MTWRERLTLRILLLCVRIVVVKDPVLQAEIVHLSNHVACLKEHD